MPQKAILKDHAGVGVRDCHAEVLARRAFLRFLHLQMRNYQPQHRTSGPETCMSTMLTCGEAGSHGLLQDHVQATATEASGEAGRLQVHTYSSRASWNT